MTDGQEKAIQALKDADALRKRAREAYHNALILCMAHHVSKTRMGAELGVTESAIRMYIKRNRL